METEAQTVGREAKREAKQNDEEDGTATEQTMEDMLKAAYVPGDCGVPMDIPVEDLKVDFSYQRQEVSKSGTAWRARHLSLLALGTLSVMQRDNGDMYIVDGYQRYLAYMKALADGKRPDLPKTIPARVFKSRGPDSEAAAFYALNVWRRPVSAVLKFHTLVRAGVVPERDIAAWLDSLSVRVTKEDNMYALNFPTILVDFWKQDKEASMEAVKFQLRLNRNLNQPLHNYVHKGLWYLFHFKFPLWDHLEKLESQGGKNAIVAAIAGRMVNKQKKSASERMCGLAVLDVINVRRKNKVGKAIYRDEDETN